MHAAEAPQTALDRPAFDARGHEAAVHAIDTRLGALLAGGEAGTLTVTMRQAVLGPGKRLRPLLALGAALALGIDAARVLDAACALELVHAASLIFDDLPCMDDAVLRRGRPACHVAAGEDVAILTGLSLFSRAFGVLAAIEGLDGAVRARLVVTLAEAAGSHGICGGQLGDLRGAGGGRHAGWLEAVNHGKTGMLFVAAVDLACLVADAPAATRAGLRAFAGAFGLAFQLLDDRADAVPCEYAGEDEGKATMIGLLGQPRADAQLHAHLRAARAALARIGPSAQALHDLLDATFGAELADV